MHTPYNCDFELKKKKKNQTKKISLDAHTIQLWFWIKKKKNKNKKISLDAHNIQ